MRPRVLLHACCGPCAAPVVERLGSEYEVTVLFYGPNIQPEEEYGRRLEAMKVLARAMGIRLVEGRYDVEEWRARVRGYEEEPEGGARCTVCHRLRLEETARQAKEGGYDCFASALTVGPKKSAEAINGVGAELSGEYGLWYIAEDFKKRDGFKRSLEMSRELGLYRQGYCGCMYSLGRRV